MEVSTNAGYAADRKIFNFQNIKDKSNIFGGKLSEFANSAFVPVLLIITWQLLSNAGVIYEVILPSPLKVVKGFLEMVENGTLWIDIVVSGKRVLIGSFWGIIIGMAFGVISGLSKIVERILEPIVNVIRQIATLAWIPLIILWFGIGEFSKELIIAKAVLVPVYLNTLRGMKEVSKSYTELSQVLELNRWTYLSKIVFPSAAPIIFTGLRLAIGNAWQAVVAAEMLGGLTGLGYALLNAKDFVRSDKLIALMIVIALIGMVLDALLQLLEKKIFSWKYAV
ncbi:MAG: ABC transporter permease [Butyrivibrio sp.]|jgi:sulfonate transport system permease protein|nr:ABC transporter permease [Butyrivibrio sp.]